MGLDSRAFKRVQVDVTVVEVGMGGSLDAYVSFCLSLCLLSLKS